VALVAATIWSSMRILEVREPHFSFMVVWFIAAGLALAWQSRVAAHLVALAALAWWIAEALQPGIAPSFLLAYGAAMLFGAGLALAAAPWPSASSAGGVLSNYGAFALAGAAIVQVIAANEGLSGRGGGALSQPLWAISCGAAGAILAIVAAAITQRAGVVFAGSAIGFVLLAALVWNPSKSGEPWLGYAFELCAMLFLVVSGLLDGARPRLVAGWLGIAGCIAAITWAVKGTLLSRSIFLAVAGAVAVVLALALNRLLPKGRE
jgi:hypothetical protein